MLATASQHFCSVQEAAEGHIWSTFDVGFDHLTSFGFLFSWGEVPGEGGTTRVQSFVAPANGEECSLCVSVFHLRKVS